MLLHRYVQPDVGVPVGAEAVLGPVPVPPGEGDGRSLGEEHEGVSPLCGCPVHHVEELVPVAVAHVLVEEVRHGADEDSPGFLPGEGFFQPGRHFLDHVGFELVAGGAGALEPRVEAVHVAEVASLRYLGAAGDGVPGPVGPLYLCHRSSVPLCYLAATSFPVPVAFFVLVPGGVPARAGMPFRCWPRCGLLAEVELGEVAMWRKS